LDEAGSLFAAIIEHNPGHFPSLQRLAAIRRYQGRMEDSLELLQKAVAANPDSADLHNSLANTLNGVGRPQDAIEHYRAAIALRPDFPEAYFNLGRGFKELRQFPEAEEAYRNAIRLRPAYAEAHSNLGIVLGRMNRHAESIASFTAALEADPQTRMAHNNIGLALTALNRHEEAAPFYVRARELEPDSPLPLFNEALTRLAIGDLERGLPGYEARWSVPELQIQLPDFAQPLWKGDASIEGKRLLLRAEQGLGDTILFARYIQPLAGRGAMLRLVVHKALVNLMRSTPGVEDVRSIHDPLPEFDCYTPMGTLPLALGTTLATIPSHTPYLCPPSESETIDHLDRSQGPLIGICWAGNPDYPNDHNRSIPLGIFQRLFQTPNVRFVSLQQNLRPGDDAILANYRNIDLISDRKGKGLADTAALISKLDLVVTVDTVIAHLSGALNCPVWVLLPFNAYWVWMRHRQDSPWYPSARLFRQAHIGDWQGVVESAAEALRQI
jgi:tetratricopeptide (TPR) repeat protein